MQALEQLLFCVSSVFKPFYYKVINYGHPHGIDEETEFHRSQPLCPEPPSPGVAEPGVDPSLSNFPAFALVVTPFCLPDTFVAVYEEKRA